MFYCTRCGMKLTSEEERDSHVIEMHADLAPDEDSSKFILDGEAVGNRSPEDFDL